MLVAWDPGWGLRESCGPDGGGGGVPARRGAGAVSPPPRAHGRLELVRRFLFSPRWLLAHVTVLAIAVLFVNLGMWQLRRLEERRDTNALFEARGAAPVEPLETLLAEAGDDSQALVYRRVRVTGSYLPDDEVLLTPRAHSERPGHHLVTPLRTPAGATLLVDRGWVPFEMDRPPVAAAAPPAGQVTVTGVLQPSAPAARSGSRGSAGLGFVSAVDTELLAPHVGEPVQPVWLLLTEQRPPAQALPLVPEAPDLTEGSHLSYALQWFAFAAIGMIGYPLLVRRSMHSSAQPTEGTTWQPTTT